MTYAQLKSLIANPGDKSFTRRSYAIANEFGIIAIAYADCEGDALDTAADSGHLNGHRIEEEDRINQDTCHLGNFCDPYNIDMIQIRQIKQR